MLIKKIKLWESKKFIEKKKTKKKKLVDNYCKITVLSYIEKL